jgi:hypothetical protein
MNNVPGYKSHTEIHLFQLYFDASCHFFSLGLASFARVPGYSSSRFTPPLHFFPLSSVALSVRVLQDPAIRTQSIRPSDGIGVKNTRKKETAGQREKEGTTVALGNCTEHDDSDDDPPPFISCTRPAIRVIPLFSRKGAN